MLLIDDQPWWLTALRVDTGLLATPHPSALEIRNAALEVVLHGCQI
jgi:hypothetical protein